LIGVLLGGAVLTAGGLTGGGPLAIGGGRGILGAFGALGTFPPTGVHSFAPGGNFIVTEGTNIKKKYFTSCTRYSRYWRDRGKWEVRGIAFSFIFFFQKFLHF